MASASGSSSLLLYCRAGVMAIFRQAHADGFSGKSFRNVLLKATVPSDQRMRFGCPECVGLLAKNAVGVEKVMSIRNARETNINPRRRRRRNPI